RGARRAARRRRAERRRRAGHEADPRAELGGLQPGLEQRRPRRPGLDPGGAPPAAGPRQPRARLVERRGDRGLAALGWLRRRQADGMDDGGLCERRGDRARSRDPVPGDHPAADRRRDRPRPRRRRGLRAPQGRHAGGVPGRLRRAAAAAALRRAGLDAAHRSGLVRRERRRHPRRRDARAVTDLVDELRANRKRFLELVADVRVELHRYCARMTGSMADGEDVVRAARARPYCALGDLDEGAPLRPWLFRIAHTRALDVLRRHDQRLRAPLDETIADDALDPEDATARDEAVRAAVSRFLALAPAERSCVILKDVLGHSLDEIAALLELTIPAVKAALHRGRVRLAAAAPAPHGPRSPAVERYA